MCFEETDMCNEKITTYKIVGFEILSSRGNQIHHKHGNYKLRKSHSMKVVMYSAAFQTWLTTLMKNKY